MVMSTVEVRPQNVRLKGSEQAVISPPRASESDAVIHPVKTQSQNQAPASFSMSGVFLTQGQQNATSVQIAKRVLNAVGTDLLTIKHGLTRSLSNGAFNSVELKEGLSRSKSQIARTIESARYNGNKVVDNQLSVKLDKADIRRFSIPGLNIHRLSHKAEQVRLDFPQGHSVMVRFDGYSSGEQTIKMLDRSLIPLGLRASLAEDGTILFDSAETAYQQMQNKVMVTGEGHRFPAGQSNVMTIKSEPDGISELTFDLSSRDGVKKTIARVNHHLRQVQQGLDQANAVGAKLDDQMKAVYSRRNVLSASQVNQSLERFTRGDGSFGTAFETISAQANVKRHSVVAIIK